ncbi:SRPBCC family protein [Lentzea cavernae]|uniref:Activator of HSP90 ATPase n=1 Tax=Lentzea cavernae TaxID=2020703 RepID=A0ABQ3MEB8_9PSEU|nr:SRPBCC family protein [Lentzea cavernae]GHH41980.1 activator of HSP90 ATPase [Lentzea cavernae]
MDREFVSATLTFDVPAERVFEVLADPATHAAIDGTGWVQDVVDRAPLTEVGQVFRMAMYHPNHPDGNYETANEVTVVEPPRAIAWRTGYRKDDGELGFGGWFWRYDITPLSAHEAEVTLTYDWTDVGPEVREYLEFPMFGPDHLAGSLRNLARSCQR